MHRTCLNVIYIVDFHIENIHAIVNVFGNSYYDNRNVCESYIGILAPLNEHSEHHYWIWINAIRLEFENKWYYFHCIFVVEIMKMIHAYVTVKNMFYEKTF